MFSTPNQLLNAYVKFTDAELDSPSVPASLMEITVDGTAYTVIGTPNSIQRVSDLIEAINNSAAGDHITANVTYNEEKSTYQVTLTANSSSISSITVANNSSLIAGSHSMLIMDDIDNAIGENPLFKHHSYNQYVYVGYGGSFKQLRYNASIGMEGIWAKAGEASYSYFRPRGNVSMTWIANKHNSVRLSYQLTNMAPNVAYLNPYNTSTDSLFVS